MSKAYWGPGLRDGRKIGLGVSKKYRAGPDAAADTDLHTVLKEIEEEELLFQSSLEKKKMKEAAKAQEQASQVAEEPGALHGAEEEAKVKVESLGAAKFY